MYIINENSKPFLITNSLKDFHFSLVKQSWVKNGYDERSLVVIKGVKFLDSEPIIVTTCKTRNDAEWLHKKVFEILSEKKELLFQRQVLKKNIRLNKNIQLINILSGIEEEIKKDYFEINLSQLLNERNSY